MSRRCVKTPLGFLLLEESDGSLCRAIFSDSDDGSCENTPLLIRAQAQIEEYFAGKRTSFDLPLRAQGTQFERCVWRALEAIPYGQTRAYGELARELGRPCAARAIGRSCGRNPLHLLVPCHRVLGADGSMTGYAAGVERKRALLTLEQNKHSE